MAGEQRITVNAAPSEVFKYLTDFDLERIKAKLEA